MTKAKYYKYAVASSIASKVASTLVQLVLMPIAAAALGSGGFALYVMLTAAAGWLSMTNLGLGPTLSVRIAQNETSGSPQHEQALFSSIFWVSVVLSCAVAISTIMCIFMLPVHNLFGAGFVDSAQTIAFGLLVLTLAYILQSTLAIYEAAQAGRQRQYTTNIATALSAPATMAAVYFTAKWMPNPVALLVAGLLPTLITRTAHAWWIASRRSSFVPRWAGFDAGLAKSVMVSGAFYSLAGSAGNFISHGLPTMLVGRVLDTAQTGSFAATLTLVTLLSGVTSMMASPAIPAIANSHAEHDSHWVHQAYWKLVTWSAVFSAGTALALGFLGDVIFAWWLRGTVAPSQELLLFAGLYFILSSIEVVHFSVLTAFHRIKVASALVFARAVVGGLLTVAWLPSGNSATPFKAMCVAILMIDLLPLFLMVRSSLVTQRA